MKRTWLRRWFGGMKGTKGAQHPMTHYMAATALCNSTFA